MISNTKAVELLDYRIRFRVDGHDAVRQSIQDEYPDHASFEDVSAALYFLDNVYVLDRNDAGDITGIDRESFHGNSWAGSDLWKLLAPWVDAGDYLEYLDTEDNDHFRVTFDGSGSYKIGRPTFA